MKTLRRSLAVAVLLASIAGLQSTTNATALTATASPPVHSVTGCCWVFTFGRWYCIPC